MKVHALRGVCIGVNQHLVEGQDADLDTAMVTFLAGIGAVEVVKDEPPHVKPSAVSEPEDKHAMKSGKKEK